MNTTDFFASVFSQALHNCIIIMNPEGNILEVNKAFCDAFGYSNEEIAGKNFSMLFTEEDLKVGKPLSELQKVKTKGVAGDDNYMVNKDGTCTWVSGESIFVETQDDEKNYIVKLFQNIHAQKQLERFLIESAEFFETLVESIKDAAVVVLDSMMRILKVNIAFIKMFELDMPPKEGNRLTDIDHSFWVNDEIKKEIRNVIVTNKSLKGKKFEVITKSCKQIPVMLSAKIIHVEPTLERKIFIMIKEVATE